jgi:hypothetical protein
MRTILLATVAILSVSAANADGYRVATGLEQAKAYCELTADATQASRMEGAGPGYLLLMAGKNAQDHTRTFDSCMVLKGYAKAQ